MSDAVLSILCLVATLVPLLRQQKTVSPFS